MEGSSGAGTRFRDGVQQDLTGSATAPAFRAAGPVGFSQWCVWKKFDTGTNSDDVWVPKYTTAVMITAAIIATRIAYSTAVAPRSRSTLPLITRSI